MAKKIKEIFITSYEFNGDMYVKVEDIKKLLEGHNDLLNEYNDLKEENLKLKEIIRQAKKFEYSDEQMHHIFENTRDIN